MVITSESLAPASSANDTNRVCISSCYVHMLLCYINLYSVASGLEL